MKIIIALLFAVSIAAAQTPEVPHKIQFAGMTLTIRDDARREIQKDVNALTQSPRHHMMKVERARTYFPIIERVLEEERVPDDFKYLVLQESALIADAVSVSNAVGFWQFKDFTALEMGLRVDKEVDERLNIVSSTRAAARYIKKNNFYFNNWIYALQAYQMGAGGVMKSVDKHESGTKNMEITSNTYWYVKKFLAHKIAFEASVSLAGLIKVVPYENKSQRMLTDLAREISVNEEELVQYNKWAKKGSIPGDRTYTVMIPMKGDGKEIILPATSGSAIASTGTPSAAPGKGSSTLATKARMKINGISAMKADVGESAAQFAVRAGVHVNDFLKWNDLSSSDRLDEKSYYLLGKKRTRGAEAYHKVLADDNLWKISQRYGVQIRKLKRFNRITSDRDLKPGTNVWLSSMKPRDADRQKTSAEIILVDNSKSFSWTVDPDQAIADGSTPPKALEFSSAGETSKKVLVVTPQVEQPVIEEVQAPAVEVVKEENPLVETPIVITTPPDSVGTIKVIPPPGPARTITKDHTVQQGETLYAIAKDYGIGVMDLVNWNSLNIQEGIKPGQVLKTFDPSEGVAPVLVQHEIVTEVEHIVKSTDTLYSVARKYSVTIKDLMAWNNKKDFNLSVGEKLKVRTK
ncbi:MAG: LysM peptidoglycan-binding domain-containing protein [Chryseolinea sp.]